MNLEAARAAIVDEMSQPISHRSGGDIDAAVDVLLAEYDRRVAELEQARSQRDAVLTLHRPVPGLFPPACQECREHEDYTMWPCDTAAALGASLGGGS